VLVVKRKKVTAGYPRIKITNTQRALIRQVCVFVKYSRLALSRESQIKGKADCVD
jgi:hypothetical protein